MATRKQQFLTSKLIEAQANVNPAQSRDSVDRAFKWASREFTKRRSNQNSIPPHTDFASAFVDGNKFLTDYGTLLEVAVRQVGKLKVTSGKIVVCDPCYGGDHRALARRIPKGNYPVLLSAADGCIAAAMLRLRKSKVVRWELALWPGQSKDELHEGQFFGYGVDAGTAAFLDFEQDRYLDELPKDQPLIPLDQISKNDPFSGRWSDTVFDSKTGANMIAFSSGEGDGSYGSYWGFDRNDNIASLVTDFRILIEQSDINIHFPALFMRPPGEVRHRALDLSGLMMEVMPGTVSGKSIIVAFYGPSADSVNAWLVNDSGESLKTRSSKIHVCGSNRGLEFSYRELILSKKLSDRALQRVGLQVYLPLAPHPMQCVAAN